MPRAANNPLSRDPSPATVGTETEPRVGRAVLPVAFVVALAFLVYLAQAELGYHTASFSPGVYEPYADLRSIPKLAGEENPVDVGREVYLANCAVCHQPNGVGNPLNSCPPLAKSDWVLAEGPARLIRIVLHGARGPITVNDQVWPGMGGMTPFKDTLTDDQKVAHVLTYVRQSPEWGNNAGPVTAEQVKAIRDKEASRSAPWTAGELLKIPATE